MPAWSGKNPTALPPGLQNHSLPAQAWANGLVRFRATVTVTSEPTTTSSTSAIKDDIIYYYHNDHLGTPMFLTDEVCSIVWRREQKPFGETTYERGTTTESLRFPGQYFDAETGLAQNWHRDYAAGLGRYVEADPIGQWGGINIYIYSKCSPIRYFDFKGLNACDDIKRDADKIADSMVKGYPFLKVCKCRNQWGRDNMDCAGTEIDEQNDSEARYYKCMWKSLSTFRKCLGVSTPREDELKPPPGSEIPNPGPDRGKKIPNNPERDRRHGGK